MLEFLKLGPNNVLEVMRLSKTLTKTQRKNVADNSVSIAQGSLSEHAYMRAVKYKGRYIGFFMLHIGSSVDDGIDVEGPYLWRLMVAKPYQKQGFGRQILDHIKTILTEEGYHSIETSVEMGAESPYDFYKKYGFVESGEHFGEELGLIYQWK